MAKPHGFDERSKTCLICGSDRLRSFRAKAFDASIGPYVNIVECRDCVFAWQHPLGRTEEQSVAFFEAAYKDNSKMRIEYFKESHKRDIAQLEIDFVASLLGRKGTLLDIGAGSGIFAEVATENNWDVTALDPAIDVDRLKNNPRIRAIRGRAEEIPEGELFDVVTLWDVIEHTTTPIELIDSAKRHLKEGGCLIIETGNYKSANRVNGGKSHWMYQNDHRWYFSPESMQHLLADSGFSNFVFCDKVLRPGWEGDVAYVGPSKAMLLKSIIKAPWRLPMHVSTHRRLTKAKEWDRAGIGIFTIAARKPCKGN